MPTSTPSLIVPKKTERGEEIRLSFGLSFPDEILKVDTQTETMINIKTKTLTSKIRLLMWSGFLCNFSMLSISDMFQSQIKKINFLINRRVQNQQIKERVFAGQ